MEHVMIDIETLSKGSYACIWTLGAVKFDPNAGPDPEQALSDDHQVYMIDKFHVRIDIGSAISFGRMDGGTVDWWMEEKQDAARKAILAMPAIDLPEALDGFSQWFGADKPVWGNGATFDNVIVSNAYQACRLERPWGYKNDRCYRTLKALAPTVEPIDVGTAHGALDDAIAQAWHLQRIVKHLGLTL
jgi:hypothetical protein